MDSDSRGNGIVLGIFNDYNLNPEVALLTFNGEVMKVDASANKKDSSYWNNVRPVPLTKIETVDYHRGDSTRVIRESKTYLDSIDRKSNKFSLGSVLSGYTWENSFRHITLDVVSPIKKLSFNTIEGWNTSLEATFNNNFGKEDRRDYKITPSIRYGFSNSHLNGHLSFIYRYNTYRLSIVEIDAGTDLVQFNNSKPISELVNSFYTLLAEKNYLKAYEKQYLYVAHRTELFNGLVLKIGAEYAYRNAVTNSTEYKFLNIEDGDYTSNDPYDITTDEFRFPSHNAFTGEASIALRPGQEYINRPEGKFVLEPKFPIISISYKKGLNLAGSSINYDRIQLGINDEMELGLLGSIKYTLVYGNFLSDKRMYVPDLKHFNGNKTWFSDFKIQDFKNLDYYTYSTDGVYIEAHVEENFGGFLLNKLPIIRKLKLREIASVHFLHTDKLNQYLEFSIGVEKLGFIRAEVFGSLTNGNKGAIGFLFGIKRTFRN